LVKKYILNVLVAIDQLASAIVGGDPDETISSRLGKASRGDYGRFQAYFWLPLMWLVDLVFLPFDGPNHCVRRIEEDEGRNAIEV
jgi:hypothetical protein